MKNLQLRGWQREAFALYLNELSGGTRTMLWEATPGAGKTTGALMVLRHQLAKKLAQSALIVVPTTHLRIQWARAAAEVGIQLDSNFGGSRTKLTRDYHGAIVTYQQFGMSKNAFRDLASRSVVILDEVHHAADGLSWGNALQRNLEEARFILCLSGTAFRSDCNPIPFVRYDKDGLSAPHFTYSYARAVTERVCRATAFFTYGGEVSWSEQDKIQSAAFSDSLDPTLSARRLRAALDPDAGWIQPMLKDAHNMLCSTRSSHARAAGLLVCADQDHARQMAKLLLEITSEKPTVVLSDDNSASKKIKQFADDNSSWLVACNMVSEGVDIPRLRVGVYATTVRTKMYFRQFLGRIVRRQSEIAGHQVAYLYLPADPVLHQLAEEIEAETRHCLHKPSNSLFDQDDERRQVARETNDTPVWTALNGFNSGVEAVLLHGNQLSLFAGMSAPEQISAAIHKEVELQREHSLTRSEIKQDLATQIKNLVGLFHRRSGKPHSVIHTLLNKAQSVSSQTHCTESQLHDRIQLLEKLLHAEEPKEKRSARL